jgi:Uma2 family endonuclease
MGVTAPQVRHWTREEYLKMADAGIFAPGEQVELIEGEIIAMTPQKSSHATVVSLAYKALSVVFAVGFYIRQQMPLALGADSEPEPDIAVVRGTPRDYFDEHPTMALLVIEVSDTTLGFDRGRKAALYAKAGIPEYWILNLVDRVLEVYRDPAPLADRPSEYAYRSAHRFGPADAVTPLSLPNIQVRVADLLP